jgi:hypothetical protein
MEFFVLPPPPMKIRNIHIVLVAALFGILAWGSVTLRDQYLITVEAPLVLESVPEGLAVKSPFPSFVQLKLRGDGWHLAAIVLGGKPHVLVSAAALPPGNRPIGFADVLERLSFGPWVQLVDMKPESIRVEFDRLARKRVPVIWDAVMGFREGYGQVGPVTLTPDSVTLSGAETILRSLDSWKTERQVLENLKAPVDGEVQLASPGMYRISFSHAATRVTINVEPFAEKVFTGIPVEVRDVPPNREVIFIPPKIELVVRAGIKQLALLSPDDFHVGTSFTRIVSDSTGTLDTDVLAPAGTQVVGKKPGRLQYIVRKRL